MKELICIMCPKGCRLTVDEDNDYKVTGYGCAKGVTYGKAEVTNPVRVLTSTVVVDGARYPRCPVKTAEGIPKGKLKEAMKEINKVHLTAPVKIGDIVISDLLGTGVDVLATGDC